MRSSEWFLTMKMLEGVGGVSLEKYSALNDMILLELRANPDTVAPRPSEHYSLVDSHGKAIPKRSFKGNVKHEVPWQIGAFASSLNWLSMRTAFYTIFSSRYEADAMLHPIRSAFQLSLAGRFCLNEGIFAPILKRFSDETVQVVKDISSTSQPIVSEISIPLFSAWLVGKTGSPRTAIAAAFEIRNEKPISEARRRLLDLEQASKEPHRKNFVRDVNRLMWEVKSAGDTLRKVYGVETKNGVSLSPLILYVVSLQL
jgi:hypothetical protein